MVPFTVLRRARGRRVPSVVGPSYTADTRGSRDVSECSQRAGGWPGLAQRLSDTGPTPAPDRDRLEGGRRAVTFTSLEDHTEVRVVMKRHDTPGGRSVRRPR